MRVSRWIVAATAGAFALSGCGLVITQGVAYSPDLGPGVELSGYSIDQYGDWHANYLQWTPVIVFEINGRYFPNRVRGAREVQVYRSPSGYFLPPRDREWQRTDRRFNGKKLPNDADYGRARPRGRPGSGAH